MSSSWVNVLCFCARHVTLTHSALIHPAIEMSTGTTELSEKPDEMQGYYLQWTGIQSWKSENICTGGQFAALKL